MCGGGSTQQPRWAMTPDEGFLALVADIDDSGRRVNEQFLFACELAARRVGLTTIDDDLDRRAAAVGDERDPACPGGEAGASDSPPPSPADSP